MFVRLLIVAAAALSSTPLWAQSSLQLRISFDASGCPLSVSEPRLQARRGRRIVWQAVNAAGEPTRERFEIFFDPLRGSQLRARAGRVGRPIDRTAPIAEYKYTVLGDRCSDRPLDPVIRVVN